MTTPNDAAIQAIRDRLAPSTGPMAQSPMSDYDLDPVTRTDKAHDLWRDLAYDRDTTYGELASSVGAEDTQAFREAINTSFMDQFPSGGGAYDAGDLPDDNPGRESDRDQGAYTSAEWYGDAQQAADDMGEDVQ